MLFHKYGGANVSVTNRMSETFMLVSTKATVKLDNGNTGHYQVIGIIICFFPNYPIIYPVLTVYYCPGHPSDNISSGALKCFLVFKRLHLKLLKIVILLTLKVVIGYHPTGLRII